MKNIRRYITDDVKILSSTIKAKTTRIRKILETLEPNVLLNYKIYEENSNFLERVLPLDVDMHQRDCLNHCYKIGTQPVIQLKKDLLEALGNDRAQCPYCQISEPVTLDHFLPESTYPEFSILSANLIPSCNVCNNAKLDRLVVGTQRLFFNPYFDDISCIRFLFANLSPANDSLIVSYEIAKVDGLDDYIYRILQHHFERLQLANRYMIQASSMLYGIIRIINNNKKFKNTDMVSILKQKANECAIINGINHWETALYHALSEYDLESIPLT